MELPTEITEMDAVKHLNHSAQNAEGNSHCTRKMNKIKSMMKESADVDNVNEGAKEFLRLLVELKRCHESVQKLLSEDVKVNETPDWFEPKMADCNAFLTEVDQWRSKSSSIVSEHMKAVADKAALQARAETPKKKHELEMEKHQLGLKMEFLDLEAGIAAADARLKALEEFESDEASVSGKETEEQIDASDKTEGSLAQLEFAWIGTISKTSLQKMIHT